MSMYQFLPAPDVAGKETEFTFWDDGFSDGELQLIIKLGEALRLDKAIVGAENGVEDPSIRVSKVSWIEYSNCPWLYDRLAYITRQINGQYYNFDLYGFAENMQFTVYESNADGQGHYGWHIDKGYSPGGAPRKLSMVLQLSDPDEYEGGDLELLYSKQPVAMEKKKGRVYFFPSYTLHQVTPVTKGTRRTLVVWVAGPKFK